MDSLIVTEQASLAFVHSLLNGKSLNLLYRGSRDGWKYVDFHSRCDNKGATLTLFKTDDGRVCGGYTAESWESNSVLTAVYKAIFGTS